MHSSANETTLDLHQVHEFDKTRKVASESQDADLVLPIETLFLRWAENTRDLG
jgi:hypothetical protein